MNDYEQRIISMYEDHSIDELMDCNDAARERIRLADERFMRSGLSSDKAACESASVHFYNLQMVINQRKTK